MQIRISQISILLPSTLPYSLFRPTFSDKASPKLGRNHVLNLVPGDSAIVSMYRPGFSHRWAQRASIIRLWPFASGLLGLRSVNASNLSSASGDVDDSQACYIQLVPLFRCGDWLSIISRMRTSFTGQTWSHIALKWKGAKLERLVTAICTEVAEWQKG